MSQSQKSNLKRNLKNRHIQFIAFGGSIGTGLFLGIGGAISLAGPSVILGYLIAGLAVFMIMRQLGEMTTEEPMAGSFSYFAYNYWGSFPGFLSGWNYWIQYVLIGIVELTAAAAYTQYWFPTIATWEIVLFFFVIINALNLVAVKAYGEIGFWLSIIKVTAICAMILVGIYILTIVPNLVNGATIKNLWMAASVGKHANNPAFSGFFSHGLMGLIAAIPTITFAFGGLELIGLTAAEVTDPQKTIPKAINQVVFRTLIFYIGSITVLLSLYHWSNLRITDSPFVMIFDKIGLKYIAWIFNFVILTAALSIYNSCIYSNSRMIHSLALQNNAPKIFAKTNKKGAPVAAQILSGILTFLVVPLNYFIPNWFKAFQVVIDFVIVCIFVSWTLITMSHMKFKKQKNLEKHKTIFPSPLYPFTNYFVFLFIFFLLVTMVTRHPIMIKQVIVMPIWVLLVYIFYKFYN
jgi:L-asparagine transporter-like permease